MVKSNLALLALSGLLATGAYAQAPAAAPAPAPAPAAQPSEPPVQAKVQKAKPPKQSTEERLAAIVQPRLGPGVKIESIRKTPYSGLYEIRAAGDILYTDKRGKYIFVGNVFLAKTSANLTKERLDSINMIKFSDLPLDSALKLVKGDGKRVIAIFEDPNCGYCKQFRKTTLKDIDNVTVYTFMYNILSPDSAVKSKNVWCAPDRDKAWDDWMLSNIQPPAAPEDCANPNDKIAELGRKLRIQGTPAIFFADGSRVPGAIDLPTLEAKLSSTK